MSKQIKMGDGDQLHRDLRTAARVVHKYGDRFMWIFKRIEVEIDNREAAQTTASRIAQLAEVA